MSGLSDTRILIVDDHHIIRAGLLSALIVEGVVEISEANSYRTAAELISNDSFDLILTDQHLGDGQGIDLAHSAQQKNPRVKMALFTFEESWALIESARSHGFSLYISKQSSMKIIMNALVESIKSSDKFAIYAPSLPKDNLLVIPLTKSELAVLALLCQGLTTREIAGKRHNSEATIKSHTSAILRKLQSRNRIEAIAKARELRLIPTT